MNDKKDFPHGPDLDNLTKRFFDALQKTVLKNDSLVVQYIASRRQAVHGESTGVYLTFEVS